jgi:hypothetical protein
MRVGLYIINVDLMKKRKKYLKFLDFKLNNTELPVAAQIASLDLVNKLINLYSKCSSRPAHSSWSTFAIKNLTARLIKNNLTHSLFLSTLTIAFISINMNDHELRVRIELRLLF